MTIQDFKKEGLEVDVKLLRAIAMGGKRSAEIQLLLDSQADGKADYQALALWLADQSVAEDRAKATFENLRRHQEHMREALGRNVGIKIAALDYLENIELALNIKDDLHLTYFQLTQIAFSDQLTGLGNFRYFSQRFKEEFARAERYRHSLTLVMLDIDHFKKFNDTFGHPAGNIALEHLAGILKAEVRETDLVARYGGEEFAVLFPETTKYDALELSERIRKCVETSPVPLEAGAQAVTISLGLATYPRDARSIDALLKGADAALYDSKKCGRNRLTAFYPDTSVRLEYKPERVERVATVSVAGEFNGWNPRSDVLTRRDDGVFEVVLRLTAGKYQYKFVIDNTVYIHDVRCPHTAPDGYGRVNSVLEVK